MASRVRSTVFTHEERDVLKEVVGRFRNIIENKKTDGTTKKAKKEAWEKVAGVFNSYSFVTRRTPEQLKKAWENLKNLRKKQASALNQHRMATGGGPSVPDLADDPLMELATPYLLHTVASRYDSDARALQGSSSIIGHVHRSVSPLASFGHLTGTPILDEEMDDFDESRSHSSQSNSDLCAEWSFPTSDDESEPTLRRSSSSQGRFPTIFGVGVEPLPSTSSAMDYSIPRNSARMESFPISGRRNYNDGTGCSREQSRHTQSATVVRSSSMVRTGNTPTVRRGRDRERSLPTPTATVASVSPTDHTRGSATVSTVPSLRHSSATSGDTPTRSANVSGDGTSHGTASNRLGVVREEHQLRMSQLKSTQEQKDELHDIRMREARADMNAALSRERADAARERAEVARAEFPSVELRIQNARVRIEEARARFEEARATREEEQLKFDQVHRSRARPGRERSPL